MKGYAGYLGAKTLAASNMQEISERFSNSFVKIIFSDEEVRMPEEAANSEVTLEITDGVYQTLWRLGELLGCGLEVVQKNIPIKQESIEVCELFDINPYEIPSGGLIYVLPDGEMPDDGCLIGKTRNDNDRIVIMRDGVRYLTKPRSI